MRLGFVLGFATGVLLVIAVQSVYPIMAGRVYAVRSVQSYYPHDTENTQVTLVVYEKGESGHVKEMLRLFPPGFQLQGDSEHGWTGIRRVRVKGVAQEFAYGKVGYRADKLE